MTTINKKNETTIPLTIKTTYLPNWGMWEGLRELVQNARDAEIEFSAPMHITHEKAFNRLVIENIGAKLPIQALLLGHTTKHDNASLIGKFGEGLKLGILALVRAGTKIQIYNGDEMWYPSIAHSAVFGENVLSFTVKPNKSKLHSDRVRIELLGITEADWDSIKNRFLFIKENAPADDEQVITYSGTMLTSDRFRGHIYVKGILVQKDNQLRFGYDLKDCDLDRDRRMIETYNLQYHTRQIMMSALNQAGDEKKEAITNSFLECLESLTLEMESMSTYTADAVPEHALEAARVSFAQKHGNDAIPVATLEESKDLEFAGKKGVIVPKQQLAVLQKKFGTVYEIKAELKKSVKRTYSWSDLSADEQGRLTDALALVNDALMSGDVLTSLHTRLHFLSLNNLHVVEYYDPNTMGLFTPAQNGEEWHMSIAYSLLQSEEKEGELLATLIHEYAHQYGSDGDQSHICAIESLWGKVCMLLKNQIIALIGNSAGE